MCFCTYRGSLATAARLETAAARFPRLALERPTVTVALIGAEMGAVMASTATSGTLDFDEQDPRTICIICGPRRKVDMRGALIHELFNQHYRCKEERSIAMSPKASYSAAGWQPRPTHYLYQLVRHLGFDRLDSVDSWGQSALHRAALWKKPPHLITALLEHGVLTKLAPLGPYQLVRHLGFDRLDSMVQFQQLDDGVPFQQLDICIQRSQMVGT